MQAGVTVYIIDIYDLEAGIQSAVTKETVENRDGAHVFVEGHLGAFRLGHDCALTREEAKELFNRHKALRIEQLKYRMAELDAELDFIQKLEV